MNKTITFTTTIQRTVDFEEWYENISKQSKTKEEALVIWEKMCDSCKDTSDDGGEIEIQTNQEIETDYIAEVLQEKEEESVEEDEE